MSEDKKHIDPSKEDYQQYLRGDLDPGKAHELEKSALYNDFESEAMEGFDEFGGQAAADDLDQMSRRLPKETRKVRHIKIAAIITFFLVAGLSAWFVIPDMATQTVVQNENQVSEPEIEKKSEMASVDTVEIDQSSSLAQNESEVDDEPIQDPVAIPKDNTDSSTLTEEQDLLAENEPAIQNQDTAGFPDAQETLIAEETTTDDSSDLIADADLEVEADQAFAEAPSEEDSVPVREESTRVAARSTAAGPEPSTATSEDASETRTISGRVLDADGFPIPGVDVLLNGGSYTAVTSSDGRFSLQVPNLASMRLIFSSPNHRPLELPLTEDEVNVNLRANSNAKVELTVLGYGPNNVIQNGSFSDPAPQGGMAAFNTYVEQNLVYGDSAASANISGKVIMEMGISASGTIQNLNIVRSLGYGLDEEAERLVDEFPPGWNAASQNGNPVASRVRLKIRFP